MCSFFIRFIFFHRRDLGLDIIINIDILGIGEHGDNFPCVLAGIIFVFLPDPGMPGQHHLLGVKIVIRDIAFRLGIGLVYFGMAAYLGPFLRIKELDLVACYRGILIGFARNRMHHFGIARGQAVARLAVVGHLVAKKVRGFLILYFLVMDVALGFQDASPFVTITTRSKTK